MKSFKSEKKALRRFLALYLLSTFVLIAAGLGIFYEYSLHRLIDQQNQRLKFKTSLLLPKLQKLHFSNVSPLLYPKIEGIRTALYDIDRNYLIGDFKPQKIHWDREFWQEGNMLFYRTQIRPYYLGAATIVAAMPLDEAPIKELQKRVLIAFVVAMIFVFVVARWLGKLFLAPMRQTLQLLDRFIQDTTHELNTPVSTILANIELFRSLNPEIQSEELSRIEIASKRISRLYDDLVFLRLRHQRKRHIEAIDYSRLLKERLDYFASMADSKQIDMKSFIEDGVIHRMDREDAAKLIDNLLSNAIKYTPVKGEIFVYLDRKSLKIEDKGIGMDQQTLDRITERFFRANQSEGGFGLGLSIVQEIVDFYGLEFEIKSQKGEGTQVRIVWPK